MRRLMIGLVGFVAWLGSFGNRPGDDPVSSSENQKFLIEFGWDEPDTAFLRKQIATMEQTPFDGCVFHAVAKSADGKLDDLAWKSWSRRAFTRTELSQAFEDLKETPFKRFKHNLLRINTTPADLDWFDDHAAILANAKLAAELAREGKCAGILLDTEQYQGILFNYRKQRDVKTVSWSEYAAQARRRGFEVMNAFQGGFPDLTVMLTFGPSYVRAKTDEGRASTQDAEYGLLVAFVAGMAEARRGKARLIDGYEPSYGYRDVKRFENALGSIHASNPKLEAGFGLWLDYDHPKYGWDVDHPDRNYFTPEAFETTLKAALDHSDGFVWIYTETPRWWSHDGASVKLPSAYVDAIRRARKSSRP